MTFVSGQGEKAAPTQKKSVGLRMFWHGIDEFLAFFDETKGTVAAYLYHRSGSEKAASALTQDVYVSLLSKTFSRVWFGSLSLQLALKEADKLVAEQQFTDNDVDSVYVSTLSWLSPEQRVKVSTLHETLWTLAPSDQRLLVLSLLIGLSESRISAIMHLEEKQCHADSELSKARLFSHWQPTKDVLSSLQSLVFVPTLGPAKEAALKAMLLEKYNALRTRRTQWLIIGGLFAVLSNVIVASVLAFAVVTQPPTSLKSVRQEVASLDAIALRRQRESGDPARALAGAYAQAQQVVAFALARDIHELALRKAHQALQQRNTLVTLWRIENLSMLAWKGGPSALAAEPLKVTK